MNTITFYLESDNHEKVNSNGETLTFTLQLTKIWTTKWASKIIKLLVFALVKNIVGEITTNKKTGRDIISLVGRCSLASCKTKKSMIESHNTIEAEKLGDFSKNLGHKSLNVSKMMAKNVLKNLGWALDIGAAFASRSAKAALSSLLEAINFSTPGKHCTWVSLFKLCYLYGTKNRQILPRCAIKKIISCTNIRKKIKWCKQLQPLN